VLETVNYTVLIPARLASTRLPDKPLADIAGKPMVVRVAERASLAGAQRVVVAADDARIVAACAAHGVHAVLTSQRHPVAATGWRRPVNCWVWTATTQWSTCKAMSRWLSLN